MDWISRVGQNAWDARPDAIERRLPKLAARRGVAHPTAGSDRSVGAPLVALAGGAVRRGELLVGGAGDTCGRDAGGSQSCHASLRRRTRDRGPALLGRRADGPASRCRPGARGHAFGALRARYTSLRTAGTRAGRSDRGAAAAALALAAAVTSLPPPGFHAGLLERRSARSG